MYENLYLAAVEESLDYYHKGVFNSWKNSLINAKKISDKGHCEIIRKPTPNIEVPECVVVLLG